MFCGPETDRQSRVHKTYCFNFIIYQESKERKNKANFIQKYMKYFIVHNVNHKTFVVFGCPRVACSRDGARDFLLFTGE